MRKPGVTRVISRSFSCLLELCHLQQCAMPTSLATTSSPLDEEPTSSLTVPIIHATLTPQLTTSQSTATSLRTTGDYSSKSLSSSLPISESISTSNLPPAHMTFAIATTASILFHPPACPNSSNIGTHCTTSSAPCDQLQPCQNDGTCFSSNITSLSYLCQCMIDFNGQQCEADDRPCKPNTCWNNGKYNHKT